jgi:hypothetical protein
MTTVNKVRVNFVRRTIPRRGPFSTERYNASMEELAVDLADFGARWNTELYPLLNSLPRGSDETRWPGATNVPDPVSEGLDGDHMFVDNAASTTQDDGLFWSSTESRPKTVRESSRDLDDRMTSIHSELSEDILDISSGLSSDQWDRLGAWVKDGTSSLDTSVSYKARTGWDRLHTLMGDIFEAGLTDLGTLDTSGFTIEEMITNLLTLHGGAWDTDTSSMDHSSITGLLQTSVDASVSYNQKARGGAGDLEDDMNHLRWEIARIKVGIATDTGSTQWSTDVTDPVSAGIACLYDHANYLGSGASASATNPHRMAKSDVEGVDTEFGYSNSFTGKPALGSQSHSYGSTMIISNAMSHEAALGALDAAVAVREVYTFETHVDPTAPIVIDHNKGIAGVSNSAWPVVQVVDKGVGGDYGVLVDEVYAFEQEHGIVTSDAFVSVEYIDANTFHVYTNVVNGVVIAVF